MLEEEIRNNKSQKLKRNKKHPYKKGGHNRILTVTKGHKSQEQQ